MYLKNESRLETIIHIYILFFSFLNIPLQNELIWPAYRRSCSDWRTSGSRRMKCCWLKVVDWARNSLGRTTRNQRNFHVTNVTSDTCPRCQAAKVPRRRGAENQGVGPAINDSARLFTFTFTCSSWANNAEGDNRSTQAKRTRAERHTNKLWQSCGNLIKIK